MESLASSPTVVKSLGSCLHWHTIAEAKKALATTFGVKPEAVEITIHG